ncbi:MULTISPECIES: hypothetical protein [unclassified Saccharothrix]|uniref:hypothetical protein n=1 Tax=unclassified Saccharothrix TaxID=2593673 RepID=UPI00307D8CD7
MRVLLLVLALVTPASERLGHTFDQATTQRVYDVVVAGGKPALTALCVRVAPGWLKLGCPTFADVVADYVASRPPEGRCLRVDARFDVPPLTAAYVVCP